MDARVLHHDGRRTCKTPTTAPRRFGSCHTLTEEVHRLLLGLAWMGRSLAALLGVQGLPLRRHLIGRPIPSKLMRGCHVCPAGRHFLRERRLEHRAQQGQPEILSFDRDRAALPPGATDADPKLLTELGPAASA